MRRRDLISQSLMITIYHAPLRQGVDMGRPTFLYGTISIVASALVFPGAVLHSVKNENVTEHHEYFPQNNHHSHRIPFR
jgi:hypothetical protein